MKKFATRIYRHVINPPSDDELKKAWQQSDLQLPVIWLLARLELASTGRRAS